MTNFNEVIPNAEKETRKWLNKFNNLTVKKSKRDSITFTNGITVSYSIDVCSMGLSSVKKEPNNKYAMPIQVVGRVTMHGKYVSSWGCIGQHDNNLMLIWFEIKHNEGRDAESQNEKMIKEEYENLMK